MRFGKAEGILENYRYYILSRISIAVGRQEMVGKSDRKLFILR